MIKDNMTFIGLDFESSSGDTRTLAPIQLGVTVNDQEYVTDIGGWDWGQYKWDEYSAKIHNIPQERLADAPHIFEADLMVSAWLFPLVKNVQRMNRIATGWNVGSFDRRIVGDFFPILTQILSYRTLDLNTVCFFAADMLNMSYVQLKKQIKEQAAEAIGGNNWHDALFDAKAGMLTYQILINMVEDLRVEKYLKG